MQARGELIRKLHAVLGEEYAANGAHCVNGATLDAQRLRGFEQLAPSKAYDAICRPFGRTRPTR